MLAVPEREMERESVGETLVLTLFVSVPTILDVADVVRVSLAVFVSEAVFVREEEPDATSLRDCEMLAVPEREREREIVGETLVLTLFVSVPTILDVADVVRVSLAVFVSEAVFVREEEPDATSLRDCEMLAVPERERERDSVG